MGREWVRPILEMLRDAGAVPLAHGGGHHKYRLPNGRMFSTSKTPSDYRGVQNDLATLRRELRSTHPEIADRGRQKKMPVVVVNKPGAAPVPISATEFANWLSPSLPPAIPFAEMETLTEFANFPTSMKPSITMAAAIRIEDKEMLSILSRAHLALGEVKTRLASYNEQIVHLQIERDRDIEKQLKLEEYIERQEKIAAEAAELVDFGVIPPEAAAVVEAAPVTQEKGKRRPSTHMPVDAILNNVLPYLQGSTNGSGFTADDFLKALAVTGKAEGVDRKAVANWLSNHVHTARFNFIRVSEGRYGFQQGEK